MTAPSCRRPKPLAWEELRFCPGCGAPYPLPLSSPRVCEACGRGLYPDPKLVACAVLQVEAGIVLVRRAFKDRGWMLPGGHVDQGEGVEAALLREIAEETGLTASVTSLVGVFSHPGEAIVVVAYAAQAQGLPTPQGETRSIAVFAPQEIPWQDLAFRATAMALATALNLPSPSALPMPAASPTLSVSKEHV